MADNEPTIPVHRFFDQVIAHLEDGDLNNDASEGLHEIIKACSNYVFAHGGKPSGSITLTLNIKLDGGVFEIKPDLKVKTPTPPRTTGHMWATPDNLLTSVNPKQLQMMFPKPRPVNTAPAEASEGESS